MRGNFDRFACRDDFKKLVQCAVEFMTFVSRAYPKGKKS